MREQQWSLVAQEGHNLVVIRNADLVMDGSYVTVVDRVELYADPEGGCFQPTGVLPDSSCASDKETIFAKLRTTSLGT